MALIRCKKCSNPISSRSKACPICGEPITNESVVAPAQQPEPAVEPKVQSEPVVAPQGDKTRTLNDILAERAAAQKATLNDSYGSATEEPEAPKPVETPKAESVAHKMGIVQTNSFVAEEKSDKYAETNDKYNRMVEDYEYEILRNKRTNKGLWSVIILVTLLLVVSLFFSFQYFELNSKYPNLEEELKIAQEARKLFEEQNSLLQRDAESLVAELDELKEVNDSLVPRYEEAVVMLEQLQREKTYNYEQLNKYKREVETLKGIMKGYVKQIDSLNTVNKGLVAENTNYRREISTAQQRADVAEEKAQEAEIKVRRGSVIQTGGIRMVPINDRDREVKIKRATRLRTDFELTSNELAEPGEKEVYLCIYGPDGYPLASDPMILFMYEGDEIMASAMRKVDYANRAVPVSIYYNSGKLESGTYKVEIYVDGRLSGTQETYIE